jgi:hypothetical protein
MDKKIMKFFAKHHIEENEIKYIIREDGKTCIHLMDGRIVETYTPLKTILTEVSPEKFINVNKGIALAAGKITSIHDDIYTMIDGRTFRGRARMPMLYRFEQERRFNTPSQESPVNADTLSQAFSILDKMPIAFCVLELLLDTEGHGIDFRFRYVNDAMAKFDNVNVDQLVNQSFYEIFKNGDKKWLIAYADVALNGGTRIIKDYSPEFDKNLTIYCFQPHEGFCACALLEDDKN